MSVSPSPSLAALRIASPCSTRKSASTLRALLAAPITNPAEDSWSLMRPQSTATKEAK